VSQLGEDWAAINVGCVDQSLALVQTPTCAVWVQTDQHGAAIVFSFHSHRDLPFRSFTPPQDGDNWERALVVLIGVGSLGVVILMSGHCRRGVRRSLIPRISLWAMVRCWPHSTMPRYFRG